MASAAVAMTKLGQAVIDRIGNTPMLRLDRIVSHLPGITLLGKAEFANPGGSVKDRAAVPRDPGRACLSQSRAQEDAACIRSRGDLYARRRRL